MKITPKPDRRTYGQTDGRTDISNYRVASLLIIGIENYKARQQLIVKHKQIKQIYGVLTLLDTSNTYLTKPNLNKAGTKTLNRGVRRQCC